MQDLWVFGYGSLMWRPGFAFEEAVPARVHGLHRSLCVYSFHHRGTPEKPGLVLGLDQGGSCRGLAFRVAPKDREETIAYLREREQVTMVYREVERRARLDDGSGRAITVLTYVVNHGHEQYAGVLPLERLVEMVARSAGQSGPNRDYVLNTAAHLDELGIHDPTLSAVAKHLPE
ncbi:MAG: gamma-glutamylcyclotransferase [Hyphomicrobiales bacterium]|nr:MAG: gamma-glutamylcyclotransferase [Hyphomicrobiales bacterium]